MSTSKTGKTWMTPEVKKAWSEPALIVIVRGKPEEAVLDACKYNGRADLSGAVFWGCESVCETYCTGWASS